MVEPREPRAREELIAPFPVPREEIQPATAYRSTWLVSSLQTLRERGHFESYRRQLTAHHDEILSALAGSWLPIAIARSHYEACDRLGLDIEEQLTMGRKVGNRAQGTILSSAVRAARGVGVTPWTIIPQFDRLYRRGANGGAAAVFKLGPKEARVEFVGCELFDIDYFRNAFRGVLLNVGSLFCERQYIHDVPRRRRGEAIFKLQWA
ncbi:MAG: hypothetical protein ACLQVI_43850 [Polyangiaceae bacterium]|jgi:hypothetical protein